MYRVLFILFFVPSFALAEGSVDTKLMTQAVAYGAVADANNHYCDKESDLSNSFINKFVETKKVSGDVADKLKALREQQYNKRLSSLKADAKPCEDLEFMMVRLDMMRKLKDISYRLNGVAEEDIPKDNIPALEHLMPPQTQDL